MRNWPSILADAKKRGLINRALAKELGVSPAAVSKMAAKHGVLLDRNPMMGRPFSNPHTPSFKCPIDWKLTAQHAQLVAVLVDAEGAVSNERLRALVLTSEDKDPQTIDVVLCRARAKLRPFGIRIERYYAEGAFIEPTQKKRLRAGAVSLKQPERTP